MGLFSGSDPIVAYDIDLGMHLVLCHGPCDQLQEIQFGERVAWTGTSTGGQITVDAPGLFAEEGGIAGSVDVLMGAASQTQNDYLQARLGDDIPAFRGVMSLVFRQTYWGRSPYLKKIAAKVKRCSTRTDGSSWYPEKADISGDMNPAHIIHECLTNPVWGLGYPVSQLSDADFRANADTLYTEGFGLSFEWTAQEPIEAFIQRVVDHIDGKVYVDPATGLFTMMLIRDGYSLEGLFTADPSNVISMELFERRGWGDAVNELTVIYRDRDTNQDVPVTLQDIGNVQVQGRVVSDTRQYPGISNETLARRVCKRDLRALSAGLAHAKIVVDRNAWEAAPGDPFYLTWPKYGIEDIVMRVVNIDTGTLTDGRIVVDIVQDVFALPIGTYLGQQPTGWESPNTVPVAVPYQQSREGLFWEVRKYANAGDIPEWGSDFGFAVAHAVKPAADALHYQVWSRVGAAAYEFQTKSEFCPVAELTSTVGYGATALTGASWAIDSADDLTLARVKVPSYAWIDNEIIAITAHSVSGGTGTLTVDRGVLDSVPAPHTAGTRIWFADNHLGIDDDLHTGGETVDLKCLPTTSLGTLDIGDATAMQQGINWRYHRPYPPGNVKINTERYPTVIEGALAVAWAHRNRNLQLDYLHTQTEGDITPEAGQTYTLRIYGENDTLVHTESGLTGTSYTYPSSTEIQESGLAGGTPDAYADVINGDSPTMYLRLGEASGVTANDETTAHDGIYTGSPTLGATGLLADDPDTCVELSGSGQYIEVANHADFQIQKFAASCIINPDALSNDRVLLHFGNYNVASNQGWRWGIKSDGKLFVETYDSGFKSAVTSSAHVTINNQYHLGVNVDCDEGIKQAEFFVDGQLVQTVAFDAVLSSSTYGLHVGALLAASIQSAVDGHLDEMAYWSGVNLPITSFLDQYNSMYGLGRLNGQLRIELESVRDGLASIQNHNIAFDRAGYGLQYGNYYGGAP